MRIQVQAASLGALRQADLLLPPGRYVALSNESEPLQSLVALLAGQEPPRRGVVLLDGRAPAQTPEIRGKLGALLPDEALPPAPTVLESVAKVLAARGHPASPEPLLMSAGVAQLGPLAPSALDQRETRSVALALALGHDEAQVAVLFEPLATLVAPSFAIAALDRLTARGSIVLCATTSPADAVRLGGRLLCVELGRVSSQESSAYRLGGGPWQQVLVETDDAPALSQLLLESPHGLSTELASPRALIVSGPALDVTVNELTTLARHHGIEIRRVEAAIPPVEALMAARAGFARGAYEAARAAALNGGAPNGGTAPSPASSPRPAP